MFRAAFPTASEEAERAEVDWLLQTFAIVPSLPGTAPLAGLWISLDVALAVAESYHLASVISALLAATPDPKTLRARRKATTGEGTTTGGGTTTGTTMGTTTIATDPGAQDAQPPAAKCLQGLSTPPATPAGAAPTTPAVRCGSFPPTRSPIIPGTRRSAAPEALAVLPTTPQTPAGSEVMAVDALMDSLVDWGVDATVMRTASPESERHTREQRELVERLTVASDIGSHEVTRGPRESSVFTSRKRVHQADSVEWALVPADEDVVYERVVVSNSRVRALRALPLEHKLLAWGALFFVAGMGAM